MSDGAQEKEFPVAWGKLAAKIWGPENGKRVLALHGWLDNAASFDALAPLLPGIRLVALDLAGHGLSDHRPAGLPYHVVDGVGDMLAVTQALGWEKFSLLGHSLGGALTSLFTGTFPQKVERLALIESLGPLANDEISAPDRLAESLTAFQKRNEKHLPTYPSAQEAVRARRQAGEISEAGALALISRGTKKVTGGITWRSDPRLRLPSPLRLSEPQVLAFLKKIQCPTLLIRAGQGMFVEAAWHDRIQSVPKLQIEHLEGAHHLHLDTPEPVAKLLTTFLKNPA